MSRKVKLNSVGYLTDDGKDVSDVVYERPVMMVYEGTFDSMDGEVTIREDHINLLVKNHNSIFERLKRTVTGDVPMRDCPPLQLDHSTSASHTIGRLVGPLTSGYAEIDGQQRFALFGTARFLGKENVEKAKDGRFTHVSIGADLEDGIINELSVTPFPAAPRASLLARGDDTIVWTGEAGSPPKKCQVYMDKGGKYYAFVDGRQVGAYGSADEAKWVAVRKAKADSQPSARMSQHNGIDYEVIALQPGEYEIYVGGKKVSDHAGTAEEVDAEAKRYIDEQKGDRQMHEKLKKHLMEHKKLSEQEAEKLSKECLAHHMKNMGLDEEKMGKHMAGADDKECKRMSDEHDEHLKHLSAEADKEKEKEKDPEKKMAAARDGFVKLALGIRKNNSDFRLELRKSTVASRLARLRTEAKITPAEIKKLDLVKLASLDDTAMEAALATFDAREPVLRFGSMSGTNKGEAIEAITKKYKLARMELESRLNMSLKRADALAKLKALGEQEKVELASVGNANENDAPAKGMLTKLTYDELCKMLDDKEKHEELKGHLKHMMDHHGLEIPEHSDAHMSALAKKQSELQNSLDQLIALASPVLGIKAEEIK